MNKIDRKESESEVDDMTEHQAVNFRLIRRIDDLKKIAPDWDRLAAEGLAPSPFKSAAWVITFFEYRLQPDQNWLCVVAEREDKLVAVLPLVITENSGTALSPTDFHTYSIEPVLAGIESTDLIFEMLDFISTQLPKIGEFEFTRLPQSAVLLAAVRNSDSRFRSIIQLDGIGNIIVTDGAFESYRADLNRNFQRNLKKSANRIEALGDVSVLFDSDRGNGDQLSRFLTIEASGWKSREESAIASDKELVAFYRKLIERLHDNDWFEWQFLAAGQETLAANLAIRFNEQLFLVKIGYNESHARLAPGSRLMELVLKRAFDDPKIKIVDLLTDMDWHGNWHPKPVKYYNLYLYPSHANNAYRKRKLAIWLREQSWLVKPVRAIKKMMGRKV